MQVIGNLSHPKTNIRYFFPFNVVCLLSTRESPGVILSTFMIQMDNDSNCEKNNQNRRPMLNTPSLSARLDTRTNYVRGSIFEARSPCGLRLASRLGCTFGTNPVYRLFSTNRVLPFPRMVAPRHAGVPCRIRLFLAHAYLQALYLPLLSRHVM